MGIAQGLYQPHTRPNLVALQIQVNYRGAMELWIGGGVDIEGFETQLPCGCSLCLLAVATDSERERLLGRLHKLEGQLDSRTQNWTTEYDDRHTEEVQ